MALETVKKLGYPLSDDWLGTEPEGWGLPDCNVDRKGRRATAARAFIDPIRGRKSLTIHSGAQVRRILMEGHRAVGIEYVVDGQSRIAHADREVILSAGAINSPHLLMLSGIGPAEELRAAGVDVLHDIAGIGRDFNDQAAVFSIVRTSKLNTFNSTLRWDKLAWTMLRWALGGETVLNAPPCVAMSALRTVQGRSKPDLRFMLAPASHASKPWIPWFLPGAGSQMLGMAAIAHPKSRGSIRLASADPAQPPRVLYNLLADPEDVEELRRGYKLLREIMATKPFSDAIEGPIAPPRGLKTDAEIDGYIRQAAGTTQHCMGSCRMGVDDDAVLDPQCRVRGLEGLRVVDLSAFHGIAA